MAAPRAAPAETPSAAPPFPYEKDVRAADIVEFFLAWNLAVIFITLDRAVYYQAFAWYGTLITLLTILWLFPRVLRPGLALAPREVREALAVTRLGAADVLWKTLRIPLGAALLPWATTMPVVGVGVLVRRYLLHDDSAADRLGFALVGLDVAAFCAAGCCVAVAGVLDVLRRQCETRTSAAAAPFQAIPWVCLAAGLLLGPGLYVGIEWLNSFADVAVHATANLLLLGAGWRLVKARWRALCGALFAFG